MLAHNNFSQFWRLLGALRSKNRAAYLGIALNILKFFTIPIEKSFYFGFAQKENSGNDVPPCVMIVSPPRSGSTIVYQALVRAIPSSYISNFHAIYPHSATTHIMKRSFLLNALKTNSNYYGYTSSLYDVYEGNEIVEKLFNNGNNIKSIRKNFLQLIDIISCSNKLPFIFKNVRAYSQVLLLHQAVPEIIFLRIKRDAEQVIQSVVKAYHELCTFHPIPENLRNLSFNDPVEFAVRQIMEIERTIDLQKNSVRNENWLEWQYEDFCENPWQKIMNLAECYLQLNASCLRSKSLLGSLHASRKMKVSPEEAKSIKESLSRFRQGKKIFNQLPDVSRHHSFADNG